MATILPTTFNHEETQRRVQHPLQLVRKYIRRYVILEGVAVTLLCMAGLFWLGLAFDYGLYSLQIDLLNLHGIDWVQELDEMDPSGNSSLACRIILLTVCVAGLLALGITKVVMRWIREFNDRSVALVLERRFHKQLGDRLITAVELADPRLSKKYGYSQAMVEKTILEAVQTLDRLPVASVFDWRRLVKLWVFVGLSTLGLWLACMVVFCLGSLFTSTPMSPYGFSWRFADVASIWTERNILMQSSYWPRRSYLEISNFHPFQQDPTIMRVARDDNRPELHVHAMQWVIADRAAPQGWRPLRWKDLPGLLGPAEKPLLDRVIFPKNFSWLKVDPEELEPNRLSALFGTDTQQRSSGEVRAHLDARGTPQELDGWLDWKEWTVDKIDLQRSQWLKQRDRSLVKPRLAATIVGLLGDIHLQGRLHAAPVLLHPGPAEEIDYPPLDEVFAKLEELAAAPRMSRTFRKLDIPSQVEIRFRGEENSLNATFKKGQDDNRYIVPLKDLSKDSSNYRFRVRGEDFYTAAKHIVLAAAPSPTAITVDKQEPAYIYYRLLGEDQRPLRHHKYLTLGFAYSTTGDTNTIEVPLGTNLVIHVQLDRKLHTDKGVFAKVPAIPDPETYSFPGVIKLNKATGADGFALHMDNLTRKHDFEVEYFDEDNIRGRRRFKILTVADLEPFAGNLGVFNVNLYPKKEERDDDEPETPSELAKKKDKKNAVPDFHDFPEIMDALLITPAALLPFECALKDDYGLVRAGYHYKLGELHPPSRELQTSAIASILQYATGGGAGVWTAPYYINLMGDIVQNDRRGLRFLGQEYVPSEGFRDYVARKSAGMVTADFLKQPLSGPRTAQKWEFNFRDDPGFDVKKLLPTLEKELADPLKDSQYLLQISVQACDNNVETGGAYYDERGRLLLGNQRTNKNGYLSFLVVTENDLFNRIGKVENRMVKDLNYVKKVVDAGIDRVKEQKGKFEEKDIVMGNMLIRLNEVRTGLISAGNDLRKAYQTYGNVLKVMEVNRVQPSRMDDKRKKVMRPLSDIVIDYQEDRGSHGKAEDAFMKAHLLVENDVKFKRAPNVVEHLQNMDQSVKQLEKLSADIKRVLDAMKAGIKESEVIEEGETIYREQVRASVQYREMHNTIVQQRIWELIHGTKKK